MNRRPGMLFSFEGIEGCGKSTQVALTAAYLESRGCRVTVTREPGGTELGREIRRLLLSPVFSPVVLSELFLYLADRCEHVHRVIRPCLEAGGIVLVDRFIDSTWVYQGYARQGDLILIDQLNALAAAGALPTTTFLLDCEAEVGLERARRRNREDGSQGCEDRFDQLDLEFHRRVREGFRRRAREHRKRFLVLDATLPAAVIQQEIRRRLDRVLGLTDP